jgi:peptidoglycan/LPS O-acetylase OafA/YrhL
MKSKTNYFYGIDFLRWFAAFGVVSYHYVVSFQITEIKDNSFLNYLVLNHEYAPNFVWLFWSISGFVFTNIYVSRNITFKQFFVARIARLYPLHLLTLIIVGIIQIISLILFNHTQLNSDIDFYHFVLHLFFASDWGFQNNWSFNTPVWSVSIEFPIYFLFFISLVYLKKFRFLFPIIIMIFFYYIFTAVINFFHEKNLILFNTFQDIAFFHFVTCIFYFFMGSFIYSFFTKTKKFNKLGMVISLFVIIFCIYFLNLENNGAISLINFFPSTVLLFFSLILFFAYFDDLFNKFFKKNLSLGNTSYSIYLIHYPILLVMLIITENYFLDIEIFNNFIVFLAFIVVLQIFSLISFKYLESPLRKIINKKYG